MSVTFTQFLRTSAQRVWVITASAGTSAGSCAGHRHIGTADVQMHTSRVIAVGGAECSTLD